MPVTGDTNNSGRVIYSVNYEIGRQDKLPNVGIGELADDSPGTRKRCEYLCLLDQCITQTHCGLWTFRANVEDNITQIGYRP